MNTARLKGKLSNNLVYVYGGIALAVVLVVVLLLLNKSVEKEDKGIIKIERPSAKYEITDTDIFSIKDFRSADISVMGIRLGDSLDDVINMTGYPDKQSVYSPNIVNIEYSKRIGLNETGLVLHFESDRLTRITFKEPFNAYLVGKTQINNTKESIYFGIGVPDDVKFVTAGQESSKVYKLFEYKNIGLEIIVRKDRQVGFSLVE